MDCRMKLGTLKRYLYQYVSVPIEHFKIHRVYGNNQDVECTNNYEQLNTYGSNIELTVKLGRALKKGEYRGKIYHLQPNEQEVSMTDPNFIRRRFEFGPKTSRHPKPIFGKIK